MADDFGKIGGSGTSGIDMLKDVLGMNTPRGGADAASASSSSGGRGGVGPRGMRMLAPDVDVEKLDRNVQRGTYLDILV